MSAGPLSRGTPVWLRVLALVLLGLNLRAAITSVATVLPEIRAGLGIDAPTAALLTSLPLLTFAIMSAPMAGIPRRIGIDRSLVVAVLALGVLTLVRPFTPLGIVLVMTALIGVAITAGNVLMPVVLRRDRASRAR